MKTLAAACLLTLLVACGGSEGPAGPPGPGVDRSTLYCDVVAGFGGQLSNTWTQEAFCRAAADVPVFGDCFLAPAPGVSEFFYVSNSTSLNWNQPTLQAGWTCQWSPTPGAPAPIAVADFPGRTEICCYTPQ